MSTSTTFRNLRGAYQDAELAQVSAFCRELLERKEELPAPAEFGALARQRGISAPLCLQMELLLTCTNLGSLLTHRCTETEAYDVVLNQAVDLGHLIPANAAALINAMARPLNVRFTRRGKPVMGLRPIWVDEETQLTIRAALQAQAPQNVEFVQANSTVPLEADRCGWAYYQRAMKLLELDESSTDALRYLEKAAGQGYGPALQKIGMSYYEGKGVKRSERRAWEYLTMPGAGAADPAPVREALKQLLAVRKTAGRHRRYLRWFSRVVLALVCVTGAAMCRLAWLPLVLVTAGVTACVQLRERDMFRCAWWPAWLLLAVCGLNSALLIL